MLEHKMIKSSWNDDIQNGTDAMFYAWKKYNLADNISESNSFKNIIKYNEIDCKTLLK